MNRIVNVLIEFSFIATMARLAVYLLAGKWYPVFGQGFLPPWYVRFPIFITVLAIVFYWTQLSFQHYQKVREDTFLGEVQLLVSWALLILSIEVAFEVVELWVLALGIGASVTYFKNRQLFRLLRRLAQEALKSEGSSERAEDLWKRALFFKHWKNVAAPYALSGLAIGVLAWFILSVDSTSFSGKLIDLHTGGIGIQFKVWILGTQTATHYLCMLLVASFVIRGIYLNRKKDSREDGLTELLSAEEKKRLLAGKPDY